MNSEFCPHCGEEWSGYECDVCGFADTPFGNEYETPEGNVVRCTEDEALEKGYAKFCPECKESVVPYWEIEDVGMCVTCWHKKNSLQKS